VPVLKPHVDGRPTIAEYEGTARLLGFLGVRLRLIEPEKYGLQREHDRALAALRVAIGADDLRHLMAAGASMSEDEAIDQAHAIR
jgi:hypothetical protein